MSVVRVSLGARSYDVVVESGCLSRAGEVVAGAVDPTSAAVLTHPGLAERYAAPVLASLRAAGIRAEMVTVPAGERHKNLRTVARLYGRLVEMGVDRKGAVVTVGGGVLGDVGGFVAATYLRGIPFVQAPTTLLAQVDASVGGKTGVDLREGKNLVGAFHQPSAVLVDPATLATLPAREVRSGLAEVIKYGIICDEGMFASFGMTLRMMLRRDPCALCDAIARSCGNKAFVVSQDETEQGRRAILNFGHTVAHALEALTDFRVYRHGEAVSIGMVSACLIGEEVGLTPPDVTEAVAAALRCVGLPAALPPAPSADALLVAMRRDKKTIAGTPRFVLVERIGAARASVEVPDSAVRAALERQLTLS